MSEERRIEGEVRKMAGEVQRIAIQQRKKSSISVKTAKKDREPSALGGFFYSIPLIVKYRKQLYNAICYP